MQIRPNTDPVMLAALGTDGAAWASAYLKQQRHFDGDARHVELRAWFEAAIGVVPPAMAGPIADMQSALRVLAEPVTVRLKVPLQDQRFEAGDPCPVCSTPLVLASGIGEYCPNRECPVLDGPALYGDAPSRRAGASIAAPSLWRRFLRAIEPWYDWGIYGWERLDFRGEGDGYRIELEWLGLKLMFVFGRRPAPQD